MQHYDQAIFYFEKTLHVYQMIIMNMVIHIFQLLMFIIDEKNFLMAISKCKIALTFLHNSQSIDHQNY